MMKKVLVITYYWPPAGGPGVQRWLKFCKYLPEFGWEPVILTVSNGHYPAIDKTLLEDVPQSIQIYRTKSGNPFRLYNLLKGKKVGEASVALINTKSQHTLIDTLAIWVRSNLFIPDARKGWNRHALRVIPQILKEHDIQLILTTGPPHSTHLIGMKTSKTSGLPWVADFRDPWTTVYYNQMMPRNRRTRRIDRNLEDRVVATADLLITVGQNMKQEFQSRAKLVEVIMNGYDAVDLKVSNVEQRQNFFEILHTGNLASNQNPESLWSALVNLSRANPVFSKHLKVNLVGNTDRTIADTLRNSSLAGAVEFVPYVSHTEATKLMTEASMLLLVIPDSIGNKAILTGKLFEYLASGVPILPIGPADGDAAGVLSECDRAPMIDFGDESAMEQYVLKTYMNWLLNDQTTKKVDTKKAGNYQRRNLTRQLSALFDQLVKTG